jgi:protein TonB
MRGLFTFASVALHAGVFGWLAYEGKNPPARKATVVAVVSKPKPKQEEPKPDEPKPKPPPPPPVVRKAAAPSPAPAPVPAPAPAPKAAPRFATNLTMGNGPALAVTGALGGNALPGRPVEAESRAKPPAPQQPAVQALDPCDAPDTKPKPLGTVTVEYPDKARADGVEGRISVRIRVGDDGSVESVEVVEGIEASLDAVVISALKTWKFAPATHCGKPVAGVLAWAQRFELGD